MRELFNLGNLYVSDFISQDMDSKLLSKCELKMVLDEEIGAPRLETPADPDKMYGRYWYRSGINHTMTEELKNIAEELPNLIPCEDGDVWLDIACNDGTMFKFIPKTFRTVGIDPADQSYYNESSQLADDIVQDFFGYDAYTNSKFGNEKAKIITCIAMFYDLDDPLSILKDIDRIMDDEGLFVVQMSYTPLMLLQLAFDNICHEHVYYHSLSSMTNLLNRVDMEIVDCKLNDINGGSFRLYIRKKKASKHKFMTAPYRDVANYRVNSLLCKEMEMRITEPEIYEKFYHDISLLRDETMSFIHKKHREGKTIWGYGASTKGNTLLQWYGLDNTIISGIAERSPYKFGLKTVGSNIPIFDENVMRTTHPDYLLILPWHFINEFSERERDYLSNGGKFIVPCPRFEIIER